MEEATQNFVMVLGIVQYDPELRYSKGGSAVCSIPLEVKHSYYSKDGHPKTESMFISAVTWGKSAEACVEHLRQGSRVLIEGRLVGREWTSKDGQKHKVIEITASRVQFITRPPANGKQPSAPFSAPASVASSPDDEVPF